VQALGIAHLVDFLGFLTAPEVARVLAQGLALALVSEEEQWGLVVNEALAFGLPILASSQIGANDVLTRNLLNGFVVELGSVTGIAHAMLELAGNEERWNDLAANRAAVRGWRTRSAFADAVELMMFPGIEPAASNMGKFMEELRLTPSPA
jgi:glycosyltransferase involved in cell wall biosynthesis